MDAYFCSEQDLLLFRDSKLVHDNALATKYLIYREDAQVSYTSNERTAEETQEALKMTVP